MQSTCIKNVRGYNASENSFYRVFIKYCVFSLKFCDFSELCQFCCSAGVLPAWCVYTHWHRGKTEKGQSPEYFKIFGKNTIFNEHPVDGTMFLFTLQLHFWFLSLLLFLEIHISCTRTYTIHIIHMYIIDKKKYTSDIHTIGMYRVFIKYCVFSELLEIFRTLFSLAVSVCAHTRQVINQHCSRTGRVQKNHKILRKNTIFNEHPVLKYKSVGFLVF